jgi:hypothetical protein
MLRLMGYPYMQNISLMGSWYRADIAYNGTSYDITSLEKTVELPERSGRVRVHPQGVAAVPRAADHGDRVADDAAGASRRTRSTPRATRSRDSVKPFFESFNKPWGSYFEPETGDYIFLQWEAQPDHVYIVQGFVPPPPIPG